MAFVKSSTYFGQFGGRYVPEMLQPTLEEVAKVYDKLRRSPKFIAELQDLQTSFNNRPTPLVEAQNISRKLGGARIFLKNEGLNHTGAHKINHCLGQALVARHLGKRRLIAETGAGQHGVATATVAAKFGFECTVYMGKKDIQRQRPNVVLMGLLGAEVVSVDTGSQTLKDAVSAALKDLLQHADTSHYVIGSCLGPDPYPRMNRDFQSIIGKEVAQQIPVKPTHIIACVGGGSNALGIFTEFLADTSTRLIGVEAGGVGSKAGQHACRFPHASVGIMEGYKSYFLQDYDGNQGKTHSIAAGLDYLGIGPELAELHDTKRVEFVSIRDEDALAAVKTLATFEGIVPALESAHAVAYALKLSATLGKNDVVVVNISGRGDKDLFALARNFDGENFKRYLTEEVQRYGK